MRHGLRAIVAILALVVGLHVFMLAGLDARDMGIPAGHGLMRVQAMEQAGPLATTATTAHDMGAACLAVLAGMLLLAAGAARTRRQWPPEQRYRLARPADPPPSPPPIALGISRT